VLLRRRPGVLLAVAGATMVMVAAVAAVPLFLSSAGTASVSLQAGERCPRDTGVTRTQVVDADEVRAPGPPSFAPLAGELTATNQWTGGASTLAGQPVEVLTRQHATEHVDVLAGGTGPGIWITDRTAKRSGLGVGDTTRLESLDVRVAAVYRDLAGYRVDRFWCSNARWLLVQSRGGDLTLPPPVVLVDRDTMADLMGTSTALWISEAGLAPDLTLGEADDLAADLACHGAHPKRLSWCTNGQPLLTRRYRLADRPDFAAADDRDFLERYFDSSLPFVLNRSRAIQASVRGGIWPVAALAALAGAGLVAAAASLWFDRRRRDVVLLSVRGVSPLGLGAKAVLELVGPLLVGAGVGVALAYGLVVWLGPSPELERAAVGRAAEVAVLALLGAAVTVAGVVTARVRGRSGRRLHLGLVPWELGLVAAAVVSYRRLGEWGVPVGQGAAVSKVDLLGLLFPVLFLLAVVAVVARLLGLGLGPLRAVSRRWPMPLFLAVRRVARARAASLGLLAATALAAGVLVYAATMGGSLHATLDAKARTFVGSDVEVDVPEGTVLPPALAGRATLVGLHRDARLDNEPVTVLAIDPKTFEHAAFWDDTFADQSLGRLLDRLRPTSGVVPAIMVGIDADGPTALSVGQGAGIDLRVENIAHVRAFPGMRGSRPTIYLAASVLAGDRVLGGEAEAWITGDHDQALDVLQRAGIPAKETRRVTDVVDGSSFVTVSWTFGFMRSLGVAAGLLAVGGVVVHLDARRRERVLGHAFLRRMGLRARQHRWALLVELVASVLVGCWIGVAAALAAAGLAHGRMDPVPAFAPEPLFRISIPAVLASVVGALLVVVLAAVVAQHRAEADDPVEVLRAGA
jgi:putative ABC transport system permease protein